MPDDRVAPPDTDLRDIAFRGGGFVIATRPGAALFFFVLILAVWELAVRSGWLNPIF
jgi:hypothetical protein